ncbi:hypothetical protein N0V93_000588 [Gnomoniopsis smithogilvyi]|uniref:Uncharacterized protein n=1 Tax=Gnomoniopsis smithogilvyi TaxID=1191159 RepID=A0A9W8Z0G2_9PEZI|nr:hypothetical protein N0V93_000588 [Gnomoniopsis smithogilvyi]
MADCLPLPVVCIQCGPGVNNPCHFKIVGPTIGFAIAVLLAIICWPLSIFFCCCGTETGKSVGTLQTTDPGPSSLLIEKNAFLGYSGQFDPQHLERS